MAGDVAINGKGSPTNTSGYTSGDPVYTLTALPTARVANNGNRPCMIWRASLYVAGNGADRTIRTWMADSAGGGAVSTSAYTVDAGDGSLSTGWRSLLKYFSHAAGGDFRLGWSTPSGSVKFGRAALSGSTVEDGYGGYASYTLAGYYSWAEVPSAPLSLAVTPGTTSVALDWAPPSSDGGTALSGYLVHRASDAAFTVGLVQTSHTTSSATISALTAGATYYFRVFATNSVTEAFGTASVPGTTVSATLGGAPSTPAAPTVTALEGAVGVAWVAPASNGSAISDYTLQYATDSGFTANLVQISGLEGLAKTVAYITTGTTWYFRVRATNSTGTSAYSASASAAVPARTTLASVRNAAVQVGGVQVELRSNGAQTSPVVTLVASTLTGGVAVTTVATIPTSTGGFAVPGGDLDLALVADSAGDLYVIGRQAGDSSTVLVKRYAKTGAATWALSGSLSQALASTTESLAHFAACWVLGSGSTPKPSILMLTRRFGTVGTGGLSYATISTAAVKASAGALFIASGSNPSWLATPPTSAAHNTGKLDVASYGQTSARVAIAADGYAVVDVANGVVSTVSKAAAGSTYAGVRVRVLAVNSTTFAVLAVVSNALVLTFYGTNGTVLGSRTIAASAAYGAIFSNDWDAYYNSVSGQVVVYYVAAAGLGRQVDRVAVSPVTFVAAAAVTLTTTLGAASSVTDRPRVPRGVVDERRVLLSATSVLAGAQSLVSVDDRSGNVAPAAPALAPRVNFDAGVAADLAWTFGDSNPADAQTARQVEIQRVSDSVNVYAPGKIAATVGALTLAANALVNGVAYRWRVATYDALDAVGAWSAYGTFSTSAAGTLTITNPATDAEALNTSYLTVDWTYSQSGGATQAQRRVRLTRVSDGTVIVDTTMQASTALTYNLAGLVTDVDYRLDLDIINSGAVTASASRLVMSSFGSPTAPILGLEVGPNYIEVTVTNPPPLGSAPEVDANLIQRRAAGSLDAWLTVASVGYAGKYLDRQVASGAAYEYRALGSAE